MTTFAPRDATDTSRSSARSRFALVGLATILTATVLNILVYFAGKAFVTYDPDFVILETVAPTIIFTVVPALIAVLLYGLLLRFAPGPERTFTIISAVILVLSIVPDLTYIPDVEGASTGQTVILIVMHVVAAAAIVGMLVTLAPKDRRR